MYKILTIGGEDYKLEYTIEAALYSDCVAKLSKFLTNMGQAENEKDIEKLRWRFEYTTDRIDNFLRWTHGSTWNSRRWRWESARYPDCKTTVSAICKRTC